MRAVTILSGFIFCVAGSTAPAFAQDDASLLASLRSLTGESSCSTGAPAQVAERLERLVESGRRLSGEAEEAMLREVNQFYYKNIRMMSDRRAWGREDFWATPAETLCQGDGDSEDFAIAKYFTLAWLGIPEDRLRLVYARSDAFGPVIVLLYHKSDGEVRVLSDRDVWTLDEVMARNLLEPVYGFNTETFWLVRGDWRFTPLQDAQSIQQWRRVMQDMN